MLIGFLIGVLGVLAVSLIVIYRRAQKRREKRSKNVKVLHFKVLKIPSKSKNVVEGSNNNNNKRKIAVLGSSGFVGSHVIEALAENGNYKIYMLGRKFGAESMTKLFPLAAGVFQVDIMNYSSLIQAFDGMDSIIDCTAIPQTVHVTPDKAWLIKVKGTKNILAAAQESGVRNIVFIMGNDSGVKPTMHEDMVRYLDGIHTALNSMINANCYSLATCVLKFGMIYGVRSQLFDGILNRDIKYFYKSNDITTFIPVEYAAQAIVKTEEKLHERNEKVCGQEIKIYGCKSSMKEFLSLPEWGITITHTPLSLLWLLSSVNMYVVNTFDWAPFGPNLCPFLCELMDMKEAKGDRTFANEVLDLNEVPSIKEGVRDLVKRFKKEKKTSQDKKSNN